MQLCTSTLKSAEFTIPNLLLLMLMQACYAPLVGVEVVIQDNGAGVLEEELTMLCEEGFRGQACRRYFGFLAFLVSLLYLLPSLLGQQVK